MSSSHQDRNLKALFVELAIDVGNTNVVVGIFEGDKVKASWRIQTERRRMPDDRLCR